MTMTARLSRLADRRGWPAVLAAHGISRPRALREMAPGMPSAELDCLHDDLRVGGQVVHLRLLPDGLWEASGTPWAITRVGVAVPARVGTPAPVMAVRHDNGALDTLAALKPMDLCIETVVEALGMSVAVVASA